MDNISVSSNRKMCSGDMLTSYLSKWGFSINPANESLASTRTFLTAGRNVLYQTAGRTHDQRGVVTFRVLKTTVYHKSLGSSPRCQPPTIAVDVCHETAVDPPAFIRQTRQR
ncbi:uncharacterized protein LOC126855193 [Cataglyphis hispanica]|uniref:uncharacterized protein LOC126855193 n=1 Tax=Cataglyphis hispanica TaxID=1086592 RepID=UPI0021804B75|nr:uncharacterized protein LOC126855193 [Cataglyphis hispanica]